jgi:hypothetical protein
LIDEKTNFLQLAELEVLELLKSDQALVDDLDLILDYVAPMLKHVVHDQVHFLEHFTLLKEPSEII